MFKAHSRCCGCSNEHKKKKLSDLFTFQPARHRLNNQLRLLIHSNSSCGSEGDGPRAHKVEPHPSRGRNTSLKTCYFSGYLMNRSPVGCGCQEWYAAERDDFYTEENAFARTLIEEEIHNC